MINLIDGFNSNRNRIIVFIGYESKCRPYLQIKRNKYKKCIILNIILVKVKSYIIIESMLVIILNYQVR